MVVEKGGIECEVSGRVSFLASILVPGEPVTMVKVCHEVVTDGFFQYQVVAGFDEVDDAEPVDLVVVQFFWNHTCDYFLPFVQGCA